MSVTDLLCHLDTGVCSGKGSCSIPLLSSSSWLEVSCRKIYIYVCQLCDTSALQPPPCRRVRREKTVCTTDAGREVQLWLWGNNNELWTLIFLFFFNSSTLLDTSVTKSSGGMPAGSLKEELQSWPYCFTSTKARLLIRDGGGREGVGWGGGDESVKARPKLQALVYDIRPLTYIILHKSITVA